MTESKKIILFSLILFCTNSYGLNNPSLSERIWIKHNLLKPEVNLLFIITVSKEMLIASEDTDSSRHGALDYQSIGRKELRQLIAENTSEQNNPYALLALANLDILSADFRNARININKAYKLRPATTEIYIAELLYQLYDGLIQLNQHKQSSRKTTLMLSTDFLEQAEKEYPDYEVPKIVHNGLNVMKVFYSVMFRYIEQFKKLQPFEFVLDSDWQKLVNNSNSYFQELIKNDAYNPYFSKLCLLMLAVIDNDTQTAEHYFNALHLLPEADNNLYRLMTISDIARADFTKAIEHMKMAVQVKDSIEDRLMLASLYSLKGDQYLALTVLKNYEAKGTAELLIHQLGYTLLSGDFISATRLYQNYRQNPVLTQSSQFVYYALIIDLLNAEYGQADKHLQALSDSELYNNALLFINHFKRDKIN